MKWTVGVLFLLFSNAIYADPNWAFVQQGPAFVESLNKSEAMLWKLIVYFERAAQRGADKKLKPTEIGRLGQDLATIRASLSPAGGFVRELNEEFVNSSGAQARETDYVDSIRVVFGDFSQESRSIMGDAATDSLDVVIGKLKTLYFSFNVVAGNLPFAMQNALRLRNPDASEMSTMQTVYRGLRRIFESSMKNILAGTSEQAGRRSVAYIYGTTTAYSSEEGPSHFTAAKALEREKELVRELDARLRALESSTAGVTTAVHPFSRESCDTAVAGTPLK